MLGENGGTVPMLQAEGVTKRYGDLIAVDEVSFVVREGEIFALLGPNGAGKTSLVRTIVGIDRPDRGRLTVYGGTGRPLAAGEPGYLPEERPSCRFASCSESQSSGRSSCLRFLAGGIYALRVFAGKVFGLSMLMYGKEPSLRELIRWAREA